MFEELIFTEKNYIQNVFEHSDSYKINDIINNQNFPDYFRYYLKGYLLEQISKLKTDIIDNHGIMVNDLEFIDNWRLFEESCYNFYKLDKNKLDEIILSSVQLNFNLIIRPKQTLVNFLFRDEIYQITETINNRIEYFNPNLEIIAELKILLEELPPTISIFNFRNAIRILINKIFKENHYSKVAKWFSNLTKSIEGSKFNSEHSVYAILSIFANDLQLKGLQQYLDENKQQLINITLTEKAINNVLIGYLAEWHSEDDKMQEEQIQPTKVEVRTQDIQEIDLDQDKYGPNQVTEISPEIDEFEKMLLENEFEGEAETYPIEIDEQVNLENEPPIQPDETIVTEQSNDTQPEIDEFEKMLLENEFEGEAETYETQSNELNEIETISVSEENVWNFTIDKSNSEVESPISEDLEQLDEIISEINAAGQSLTEQIHPSETSASPSEEEELERLAELIGSKSDIQQSSPSHAIESTNESNVGLDDSSEIENLINNLSHKLHQKIHNSSEFKSYEELAKQIKIEDLNYVDLSNPELSPTKKELYKLLLDLNRKKFNY